MILLIFLRVGCSHHVVVNKRSIAITSPFDNIPVLNYVIIDIDIDSQQDISKLIFLISTNRVHFTLTD